MKNKLKFLLVTIFIFSTTNLSIAQWIQTGELNGGQVYSIATDGDKIFAGTSTGGVFLSTDNGENWTPTNNGLPSIGVKSLAVVGMNLYAGMKNGEVYLSTNKGANWYKSSTWGNTSVSEVTSFAVSDTVLFASVWSNGIYRTANGIDWTTVFYRSPNYVTSVAFTGIEPGNTSLFVGTGGINGVGIFHSDNNFSNWAAINTGLPKNPFDNKNFLEVNAFAILNTNLFAGTESGIYLLNNDGTSWIPVNSGLSNKDVGSFAVSGSNLFVGLNYGGVYSYEDNDSNWTNVSDGIPGYPDGTSICLAVSNENYLFAGTYNGKIWRRPIAEINTSIKSDLYEIPKQISLNQNYPNPFNPTTIIDYDLPIFCNVELIVFDILGRQVKTLVDEEKSAGHYKVEFNASGLSSGIYFYQLRAGNFNKTKKLILMQ